MEPGVLQFIGPQRVGHNWATEQQEKSMMWQLKWDTELKWGVHDDMELKWDVCDDMELKWDVRDDMQPIKQN